MWLKLCDTNHGLDGYRGIYRFQSYSTLPSKAHMILRKYEKITEDTTQLPFSEENFLDISQVYDLLKQNGNNGEIILFGDEKCPNIEGFHFLGYDICADSMYFSPLGDGFLAEYQLSPFFSEMDLAEYEMYLTGVNSNGLFASYYVAQQFANYCEYINKKHLYCIESENGWRPFWVLCYSA